ncbi:hypothetical protein DIRU0_E37016 [Diutina rugosa]
MTPSSSKLYGSAFDVDIINQNAEEEAIPFRSAMRHCGDLSLVFSLITGTVNACRSKGLVAIKHVVAIVIATTFGHN